MRPIKLIMSAFGPYGGEETLDFSVLEGRNIFLVTGVTGAGKTTIFDAISYALFGEASGSSRETQSLRSHFASDDTETYVDFTFEVKGEIYQIIRAPEQEVKKKRGEGTTIKGTSVELILPKGEKPLTKSGDVQTRIREIIGVDKDQFRQIVMLPQGEFRKLLESKSSEREVIFRRIFGTQAFQRIQLKLRERKSSLNEDLKLDRNSVGIYIKNLKAPEGHALEVLKSQADIDTGQVRDLVRELKEEDETWIRDQSQVIEEIKQTFSKYQEELTLASENNKKVIQYQEAKQRYKQHLQQEKEIEEARTKVAQGKRGLEVKIVDDEMKVSEQVQKSREEAFKQSQIQVAESLQILNEVKEEVVLQKAKDTYRQSLRDEINQLIPYKEKLSLYIEKQKELKLVAVQLERIILDREQCEQDMRQLRQKLELLQEQITQGIKAEAELGQIGIKLEEYQQRIKSLGVLYKQYEQYLEKEKEYHLRVKEIAIQEKYFLEARKHFQDKEDLFRKGQAGLLAEKLEEGMPCPVCGSLHHPQKSSKLQGIPTEEELKVLQLKKEEAERAYQDELNRIAQLRDTLQLIETQNINPRIEELGELLGDEFTTKQSKVDKQQYIKTLGENCRKIIDTLKDQYGKNKLIVEAQQNLQIQKERDEEKLKESEKHQGILAQNFTEITVNKTKLEEQIFAIEEGLPKELRDGKKLEEKIIGLERQLQQSEADLEAILQKEKAVQAQYVAHQKEKELKAEEYEKANEAYETIKKALVIKLEEQCFKDYEEYRELFLPKEEVDELIRRITQYEQDCSVLKALYESAKEAGEGLAIKELEELENNVICYQTKQEKLLEEMTTIKERVLHNQEQLKFIEKTSDKISGKEKEYAIVAELENVAFGDTANKKRMTFESYVLTAYFDEIIFAANKRLDKMSGGRFELRRKEELGKGKGKQGLELEVLDYHTGKSRDVKTLSGGEGFKASLSLALGLADVIQSHAGGISIETMFIDEGFGTLDPASLDNAIECLLGLQQGGRLIGIISHVPELKERVEVTLEVSSSTKGSQATFSF